MNRTHAAFFKSPQGRRLEGILRQPYHRYGYILMSATGQPAINAATWELDPEIAKVPASKRDFAKQACGALVGDLVIALGAQRAVTRSGKSRSARIRASQYFTTGAVWVVPADALEAAAAPMRSA